MIEPTKQPPFRVLSQDEFLRLSKDEKIAYLAEAIQAVSTGRQLVGVITHDKETK